ncbi:UDP-glucose 4-epimerase [Flavobacteriales bacterium]|nr:UDP-glucose 4-epimerase [Flavobacteriales bacterium]MCL4816919.1 UDP-glucose 4-epimerase GalE [Flavobacteriales bacterium]WKZ75977.1 MAG: UDP-glucose 4-epimerase GalE [Vicingaceae bacterium]GIK70417.1 MAG: UDP-glucose 4-epimerase [Bacteroidota bacterium]CAG0981436.1 UDP-glucose 4-epimerase [Flavobacteriales bacterium]
MNILVTGGAGYIGSHTIIELQNDGHHVVSVDNYLTSSPDTYKRIQSVTGIEVPHYHCDLTSPEETEAIFHKHQFDAVIHFAALKLVGESVLNPTLYYRNNLNALINILQCMEKYSCKNLIFSSSCSVYGNSPHIPVTEKEPFGFPESPYAATKQISEILLQSFIKTQSFSKCISLRYFNPVGAHPSGFIGEIQQTPNNLLPVIMHSVIKNKPFTVFGNHYPTPDGTCIRDYIHVSDVAKAHVAALAFLDKMNSENRLEVFNIGTETGNSVLELIHSFEKESGIKLNYSMGEKRAGDIAQIYADISKAKKILQWQPLYTLDETMKTAWRWLCKMKEENILQ